MQVLLCALPLEDVVEAHGKGIKRTKLQSVLEKTRKAGKHEILLLLPATSNNIVYAVFVSMDLAFVEARLTVVKNADMPAIKR